MKDPDERYDDAYKVISSLSDAIGQPVPQESAAIRESFLQAAKFVGRREELSQLEDALSLAQANEGSTWLIGGESGTGKTRLLDELRIRALVKGFTVVRGHGVAGGGLPYQLWREPMRRLTLTTDLDDLDASILEELVPDIEQLVDRELPSAPEVDASEYQQRLIGTITSVFQRQTQPTLVLLEDLQWLKESLEVLRVINDMLSDLPILIVGTYRHEERPDLPDELKSMRLMRLDRLSDDSIAELTASMLGVSGQQPEVLDFLQRETEGNVFFLVEVVRALAEDAGGLDNVGAKTLPAYVVAGGMQTVIERRLARVPQRGQRLLRLTAVAGRELDLKLLDRVRGDIELDAWLTNCANSAVLEVQDEQWLFAHDKLRQFMLQNIDDSELPELHGLIAEALDDIYPDAPEQAVRIAKHWQVAGNKDKERFFIQRAGEYFLHISGFRDAINYLNRALELLPEVDLTEQERQQERAKILLQLSEAHYHTGDYERANQFGDEARQLFDSLNQEHDVATTLNTLGDIAWISGDYDRSIDLCEQSLAMFEALDDKQGMGDALNRIGQVYYDKGNVKEATPYFERVVNTVQADEGQHILVVTYNSLGLVAYAQGDYAGALQRFEETLEIARSLGDRRKIASILSNLGSIAGILNDFDKAATFFKDALGISREIGNRRGVGLTLHNLGRLAFLEDSYDQANSYFEESLSISLEIGNPQLAAETLISLGDVSLKQNNPQQAAGFFEHAMQKAYEIGALPHVANCVMELAGIRGVKHQGLAWLYVVVNDDATREVQRVQAKEMIEEFESKLSKKQVQQAIADAERLSLEAIANEILQLETDKTN